MMCTTEHGTEDTVADQQISNPNHIRGEDAEEEEAEAEEWKAVDEKEQKEGKNVLTYPLTANAPVHVSILYGVQVGSE